MAYVPQIQTDEEEKQRQEQLLAASGVPGAAGAGGAALPAGAQPSGTSGASGNYTNLQRYLDENKSQSGDLAQKVAGTVTSAGEEAKTAAQNVADEGNKEIQAARVPEDTGLVEQASKNPTSVAADAAKTADFQKERDAAYTGPTGLDSVQGFQSAQDLVRQAQEKAGLTDTEAGRTTLLSDMGGPGYGQGKADLNQLLLSGDPDAAATLSAAAQPYKNLQDFLTGQNTTAQASAADAAKEAAATQQDIQARFTGAGGVIPSFQTDLQKRLADAGQQAVGYNTDLDSIIAAIHTGQPLTPAQQATIDADPTIAAFQKQIPALQGVGISEPANWLDSYFNPGAQIGIPGIENITTSDDLAREQAINTLMGGGFTNPASGDQFALPGTFGTFDDKSAAGGIGSQIDAAKANLSAALNGGDQAIVREAAKYDPSVANSGILDPGGDFTVQPEVQAADLARAKEILTAKLKAFG